MLMSNYFRTDTFEQDTYFGVGIGSSDRQPDERPVLATNPDGSSYLLMYSEASKRLIKVPRDDNTNVNELVQSGFQVLYEPEKFIEEYQALPNAPENYENYQGAEQTMLSDPWSNPKENDFINVPTNLWNEQANTEPATFTFTIPEYTPLGMVGTNAERSADAPPAETTTPVNSTTQVPVGGDAAAAPATTLPEGVTASSDGAGYWIKDPATGQSTYQSNVEYAPTLAAHNETQATAVTNDA